MSKPREEFNRYPRLQKAIELCERYATGRHFDAMIDEFEKTIKTLEDEKQQLHYEIMEANDRNHE